MCRLSLIWLLQWDYIITFISLLHKGPPLMDCYLDVVEGLVCLCDPANSAGRGLASGRCNQAGKINGERPDKRAAIKKGTIKTFP